MAAILAVGVALRVWQYLANMSMWFDELSIARNVSERSLGQLLGQPLAYQQTAPLGFLAAVDIAKNIFGPSDLSLRLFPFLCGIAALFLFWRVAERTLEGAAVPIAVALFALSPPLIRYSAELKQYGVDVVAILVLTLVALDLCRTQPTLRRCLVAGGVGIISVFFSQAAVLVLAGLGAALFVRWAVHRDAAARRPVFVTVPIWACAAIGGLVVARQHMTTHTMEFMHWFWRTKLGFLPLPPTASGFAIWTRDRFAQFFDVMSSYPLPLVYTVFALTGLIVLWRRRDVALILAGPVAVTLAAAIAQQYPFRWRVVLFLLPTLLLTSAATVGWMIERASAAQPALGAALAVALLAPPLVAIFRRPPPYTGEPFKPVFAYVQAHRQPGDRTYVYANTFQAITRYGAQYGMPPDSYVAGACDEQSILPFLVDVDRFRGTRRLWVIGSSVPDFRPARRAIGRYLSIIGVKRDSMSVPSVAPLDPVSADLFDLSDTTRLRLAAAATFPFKPDTLHALCFDWVHPTPSAPAELPR
ncbi:MAG TPA: glycosyltransferase family 39 protein [Gemmatimonadaceae bacterium]